MSLLRKPKPSVPGLPGDLVTGVSMTSAVVRHPDLGPVPAVQFAFRRADGSTAAEVVFAQPEHLLAKMGTQIARGIADAIRDARREKGNR